MYNRCWPGIQNRILDYYVLDTNGTQLGYNKVNQPLSFLAGKYTVKVGKDVRPVTITADQATMLKW